MVVIGAAWFVAARSRRQREEVGKQLGLQTEHNALLAKQTLLRNEQLSLSAEMLQAMDCVETLGELDEILHVYLKKSFPGTSGAIYFYRNSRDVLERSTVWGPAEAGDELMIPTHCWGLRLGKTHQCVLRDDLVCAHSRTRYIDGDTTICMPMLSHGDVIGLMVVSVSVTNVETLKRDFIITVTEQLACH